MRDASQSRSYSGLPRCGVKPLSSGRPPPLTVPAGVCNKHTLPLRHTLSYQTVNTDTRETTARFRSAYCRIQHLPPPAAVSEPAPAPSCVPSPTWNPGAALRLVSGCTAALAGAARGCRV